MKTLTRRNRLRGIAVSVAALTAVSSPMLAQTSDAADAPTIQTSPVDTPKGPQPSVPYLVDGQYGEGPAANRVIADGALRVPTPAGKRTTLYGKRGTSYIVSSNGYLHRVEVDGTSHRLAKAATGGAIVLSENGKRAAIAAKRPFNDVQRDGFRLVEVINTKNGDVLARNSFRGQVDVLAVDGRRVIVSSYIGSGRKQMTLTWNYKSRSVDLLVHRYGTEVDLAGNRLAAKKGRPSQQQCVIVSKLSNPQKILYETCAGEQVDSFGPNGLMVTYGDRVNNQYTGDAVLRDRVGTVLARYDVPVLFPEFGNGPAVGAGFFSQWEPTGTVLIGQVTTTGPQTYGLARCTAVSCEPAGASWTSK